VKCRNILLVDDDPGFLTALSKLLTKRGYAVTTVVDAVGAAEELANCRHKFDLVITDLSMPKISGLSVLAAIKGAFPHVNVIVITAFGDEATELKAMQEGAFAFVHKPLDTAMFLSLIEQALAGEKQET
jgi:DNA-binding NtrC family response regulator